MSDKQTVIADLAAAADELHRSAAGHPNVVKAIERAIAHLNSDVIEEPATPVALPIKDAPVTAAKPVAKPSGNEPYVAYDPAT